MPDDAEECSGNISLGHWKSVLQSESGMLFWL